MLTTPIRLTVTPLALSLLPAGAMFLLPRAVYAASCPGVHQGRDSVGVCAGSAPLRSGTGGSGIGGGDIRGSGTSQESDLGCPKVDGGALCELTDEGAPPAADVPTEAVASMARDRLVVAPPRIHTAPSPRTFVKVRTSLWVDQDDFVPHEASASAGGQTVTATATPRSVTWNMVENTVTCASAGSPTGADCGYAYNRSSMSQPGGEYSISATITWSVAWTCEGACDQPGGTLADMTQTSFLQLRVGEIQTNSRT